MSEKTVLVIDDSATIRRLCDGELSAAGYRVLLAPTAEEGVATALEQQPNLIILDHQLPGTTGYEVCCQLLQSAETAKIPVVASSTLRKKAYAEYIDCDNVVDMLPKPYSPEALIATVENAINTAEMVVESQSAGSSVPEVIDQLGEADMAGQFGCFGLRELIDLLNNGTKTGLLEVETERFRCHVYVGQGRVQAVTASGLDPQIVASKMPAALSDLAPVVKFTLAGRKGSELDGIVELLNNKVLDPRLLKKLLRLQSSVLLKFCFDGNLKTFRFNQTSQLPPLFNKLPMETSLLSLLVEGSLICDVDDLQDVPADTGFVRKAIRGQNLDRAGLSSRHMRLMNLVAEPVTLQQISEQLGWPEEEARRVANGFELCELVERRQVGNTTRVFCVLTDADSTQRTTSFFKSHPDAVQGRVVRDLLGLRLLFRRSRPDVLMYEASDQAMVEFVAQNEEALKAVRLVMVANDTEAAANALYHAELSPGFDDQQLSEVFECPTGKPAEASPATVGTDHSDSEQAHANMEG